MNAPELPDGLDYVRTTDLFGPDSAPPGLLRAHKVANGVWGQLVVRSGHLRFVFEDDADEPIVVAEPGDATGVDLGSTQSKVAIPPGRLHHVEFDGPVEFVVEFYKIPDSAKPEEGHESSGLDGSSAGGGSPEEA